MLDPKTIEIVQSTAPVLKEHRAQDETEHQPGGWEGYRSFVVDKKVHESDIVTSFYLKPKDRLAIASYEPGQYLTIKTEIPGEKYTHIRHYSLSEAPGKDYYRISVKREDTHGDAPRGGIGITPLLSMLNAIVETQSQRQVTFIHATTNSKTHAFKEYIAQLKKENQNIKSFVLYDSPIEEDRTAKNFDKEGYIDLNWLQSILPSKEAHFYFCGPIPFMKAINQALKEWDIPKERIHYKVFNPIAMLDEK